ncbi:hypothetical protein CFAM422_009524 [Trichoderma lentiforme]|uniref:Uncharacterized protein n=1 Tax=Trichoderma lentiforme TaxID=1567552 RepID=A0A9P5CB93_9HYPO|nr:hypothetical protein CFAM422_009524 [Trichoderma lentiforme]
MKPIAILAALGSLQAIAAQVIPGKMIWVDKTTCDPWAKSQGFPSAAGSGGLFTTAYDILDKMVIASSYRVYHPTTQSPTTLPANVLAWERYRLNSTYTAFWGNNTATTSNLGGPLGVWNIANALYASNVVWGPGTETPFLMVVCDDAPYISKNSSSGKYLYTDPYHHLPVELTGERIGTDGTTKPCALNGESGYSYDNNVKFYQNVIFCTKNFKLPLGFTSNGPIPFSSGTTLDTAGKSWLGALYTQVLRNTGSVGIFGDYDLSFGYAASHAMRFERDSVYNPDSHKFFSIAHLFDNLFWASGVGQTSQQEYASLQKTAAGKALIAAFGLTNIAVPARGVNWAAAAGWVPPSTMNSDSPLVPPIPSH